MQCRGSVPLFWYQEASPLSPKPDILLQRFDPLYKATSRHFRNLIDEYGGPLVVLSLLKQSEKRQREMILSNELRTVVGHYNWRLKCENEEENGPFAGRAASNAVLHKRGIVFVPWDYNKYSKLRDRDNVMSRLIAVTAKQVDRVGMYVEGRRQQCGVLRTNCIDCLDRTNVAQCAAGFIAFGTQMHEIGAVDAPELDFAASASSLLMDMYQKMGNDLALQYGGSEAHSAAFKEQKGEWTAVTQSKELLTSLRRFYSNSYSDAEKQDEVNLLLGNFVPAPGKLDLWDLDSDYYLHHPFMPDKDRYEPSPAADWKANADLSAASIPRPTLSIRTATEENWSGNGDRNASTVTCLTFFDDMMACSCNRISDARLYRLGERRTYSQTGATQRSATLASPRPSATPPPPRPGLRSPSFGQPQVTEGVSTPSGTPARTGVALSPTQSSGSGGATTPFIAGSTRKVNVDGGFHLGAEMSSIEIDNSMAAEILLRFYSDGLSSSAFDRQQQHVPGLPDVQLMIGHDQCKPKEYDVRVESLFRSCLCV